MKRHRRAQAGSPRCKVSYAEFRRLVCRAAKPAAILAGLLIFAPDACPQTNFFPLLECKNRIYTNATIESATPATVTIFWDGGGERIPITNLPPELLTRYHYDPQAAREYLDAEAAKKAALQESADQALAAIALAKSTLGPAQKIRVVKVISNVRLQIEAEGKVTGAYVHNLPPEILAAFRELNQTKAEAEWLEAQIAQDQYAAKHPVSNPAAGSARAKKAAASAQKNAASAARKSAADAAAALVKVKARLKELESRATFMACPTDFITSGGARQWEYQPAAASGITQNKTREQRWAEFNPPGIAAIRARPPRP